MIGFLATFFVAPALVIVLLYLRKLVKSMSKKQRKKFVKCTILTDVLIIVSLALICMFWKNVNAMDAVAIALVQGVKTAIIPTFCILQAYAVIVMAMCCIYKDYETNVKDLNE